MADEVTPPAIGNWPMSSRRPFPKRKWKVSWAGALPLRYESFCTYGQIEPIDPLSFCGIPLINFVYIYILGPFDGVYEPYGTLQRSSLVIARVRTVFMVRLGQSSHFLLTHHAPHK